MGQASAEKAPVLAGGGASLPPPHRAHSEPPCTPYPGFCPPLRGILGVPCLLPAARCLLATMPRMLRAGGHPFPATLSPAWRSCHLAARPIPGDALPLPGAGERSPLPPNLRSGGFGVALGNTPANEGEGCCPLGCCGFLATLCASTDRSGWGLGGTHGHRHRNLHPSPEPAGRPSALAPIVA